MDHGCQATLLEDEPRFAGGSEVPLACAHLSLIFDKAIGGYLLSCDDEDGEAVRIIHEPSELEQVARHLLAARAWPSSVGIRLAPLSVCGGSMEPQPGSLAPVRDVVRGKPSPGSTAPRGGDTHQAATSLGFHRL